MAACMCSQVDAFKNYAAYMETSAFQLALQHLVSSASSQRVCIMCSETLWWRCHRRMISDALVARELQVLHLGLGRQPVEHKLWDLARVVASSRKLVYDK